MNQLANYIEVLASKHIDIRHSEDEIHYLNATREKVTALDSVLHYPAVILNRGEGFGFSGVPSAVFKDKEWQLFFVEHVTDTSDYEQIEEKFSHCEAILEEFLNRILEDKRKPQLFPFLRTFDITGVTCYYVENSDNSLYGVMAVFDMETTYCEINTRNPFK